MGIDEVFKVLSKGVMVSINSQKYLHVAKFLMIDENYDEMSGILKKLGFTLVGENGYFFISKKEKLSDTEVHAFINTHKNIFIAIAILKQLFPYVDRGDLIKQTEFTHILKQKDDVSLEQKLEYLFGTKDLLEAVEKFFDLLAKHNILEKKDNDSKDEYLVLSALEYYAKIVQSVVEG